MKPENPGREPHEPQRPGVRPAFDLEELLGLLERRGLVDSEGAKGILSRATTLRSRVVKERVGSVRSQAAARYAVTPAEIIAAAGLAQPEGGRPVDEDAIAEALAAESGVPYHKIDPLQVDNDLVAKTLSRPFARHHVAIPLRRDADGLCVTVIDPFDGTLREQLESVLPEDLHYVVAAKSDILRAIDRVYGFRSSVSRAEQELGPGHQSGKLVQLVEVKSNDELSNSDEHVVAAVDYLLNYAYEQRASDIHLEPRTEDAAIRFRIDGILHDIETVPYAVHGAITSRVKVMAGMNIAERRKPQDGRIKTLRAEREVELRVSSMATAFGEKIVIRVFDPTVLLADIQELGLAAGERELFERWITSPNGLVLVTGPTGSGKTTSLYSTLRYLAGPEINITSVEDPIELVDPRFCQVQVNPQIDISFASALRTILRQDPDVIMVGEIRDRDTAQMAVQAALTGHLVFSTVHTRNAAGAVTRLIELGVEPFLLSSVLRGVMAQRLIRRICQRCAVEGTLNADQVQALGLKVPAERRENLKVRWGEGCVECRHTGLYGRTGVFEMLDVGRRIRKLVNQGKDAAEIAHAARIEGMEPLREAALRKLAEGVTTYEEVVRLAADVE
ncbi:MAG: GspE/PulE family protein [Myxococcota bacterium]|jgi:general secretion pathway protein E|nr:type II secretion system protein E [Deltaproteobacteria bacterium]MCP4243360.1 type II/IV secretion system protein [bacterium]MDP6073751.1 GspE/PulE family protein [Myxococcota bacterium]MDP6244377.1 GspE/PulE family protein [Myxococcota bacterium]MDP7073381.1 GspE/PulE family protein [Myxococcota bacterium]